MPVSPEINPGEIVYYTITCNGQTISDTYPVVSVTIDKYINKIGNARVKLIGNIAGENLFESEGKTFTPGTTINISAGYSNTGVLIFQGMVTAQSLDFNTGEAQLIIDCREFTALTLQTNKSRVFTDSKDSDIIQSIVSEYNLTAVIDETVVVHHSVVQYNRNDWDFILERAALNGLVVMCNGREIIIARPAVNTDPVLGLTYGSTIFSLNATLNADCQYSSIKASGWDSANQQAMTVNAVVPLLNSQGTVLAKDLAEAMGNNVYGIEASAVADEASLQIAADAKLQRNGLARIRGTVSFQGSSFAKPNSIISLAGLTTEFNGNAYISGITHTIDDGNWQTTSHFGMAEEDMALPLPGSKLAIDGLQIGKVTKLNDPENECRIEVELPLMDGYDNKVWARIANFSAGNGYGAFFMPDIGDEVIVGFFNNDPGQPVVMGSLYSSANSPSEAVTPENYKKIIRTKSGVTLSFDDESKEISLTTPGGNSINISDDQKSISFRDQNSNYIVMSQEGIAIESCKNLVLKAAQGIEIYSGATTKINCKSDLKMEALDISANAQASFKAKGTASADLSASGQVTVKGAIVMIN